MDPLQDPAMMDAFRAELERGGSTGSSSFEPTTEERRRIAEGLKDPEFLKMFADYVKEISDPAVRAEREAYIGQLGARMGSLVSVLACR